MRTKYFFGKILKEGKTDVELCSSWDNYGS